VIFSVSHKARASQVWTFVAIAAMVLAIVAAAAVAIYKSVTAEPAANSKTLCPGRGALGHVVFLVDKSDPMTFTQKKAFEVLFREMASKDVPKGHLLSVYALEEDFSQSAEPLFEICNPGDGSDVRVLDGNPAQEKKKFEQRYLKPVLALESQLTTEMPGRRSPILEMIQLASITGFARNGIKGERRLVIISDMIHNTPALSMYKNIPSHTAFSETPYGRKTQAELTGVKVEIHMLMNSPQVQTPELLNFWAGFIQAGKGRLVLHTPMP
jgi:hypothetical protein